MRYHVKALALIAAVGLFSACANSATMGPASMHRDADSYQKESLASDQRYIVDEPLQVQDSLTQVGKFNARMIFMTDQLERNADRKSLENTFIVTSFVNLDNLNETTSFGRLVAEDVIHELQVRKWKVYEVRLAKDTTVNEHGEFSLSRDIQKIRALYKIGGVVTGTYSVADNHLVVNARVMDIGTGLVISSGQIHLPRNHYIDSLLFREDRLSTMKIVGDTPYSCRDIPTCWGGQSPAGEGSRK
ncbi:FlgO family outer membrane protein [Geomonas agri]|uniref:FlgO family outer membrane protein n=1 Tax=Geomonas agri TaxID=2873702 RepID=UPI001CD2ABF8|nr:FlgO family outer membrane protein [Geomonas agri]